MNYLMVDISGKVLNYDIALCEAISKNISPNSHLKLLAANLETNNAECDCKKLISFIPKSLQNSENKLKRTLKAVEAILNYCYLFFWMLFKKVDVLHLQWLPFLEVSSIERFFLKAIHFASPKTKYLLTIHNLYPHNCTEKGKIAYKKRFALVEYFFDKFIVHLEVSKKEFCSEFCIDKNRVDVVPHGVFVPKFFNEFQHKREKKLNLIMYGNQSCYKGTDVFIDALALLPKEYKENVHALIVGKTSLDYLSVLKEKAQCIDVDFIPKFVPDNELYEYVKESDVIVLPYREISQSGVLLLALNFEKMIIASDLPSFKETLAGIGDDAFFENENPQSLADIIKKHVDGNIDEKEQIDALERLKTLYSWENVAKQYVSKYMTTRISHILVCSDQYPTQDDPVYAFVGQLVNAFADQGVNVSVVSPQSLTKHYFRKSKLHPVYRKEQKEKGTFVEIIQPYMITLGGRFKRVNELFRKISLWFGLAKVHGCPQVCYGHFWRCAYALYGYARKNKLPLFVASGEASIKDELYVEIKKMGSFLNYYSGCIFVSSKNRFDSQKLGLLTTQENIVFPNSIDSSLFYPKDKMALRNKYKIPLNSFIVIFVGGFINRKGPDRVAMALNYIADCNIKAFFIGREHDGEKFDFDYDGILFKGEVLHDQLVDYLNMSDVFVLPTLAEGCCNAIIEAMACGLPIISSNLPFNDDVLDDECSFRINPNAVCEIADGIKKLKDDSVLCRQMGIASLKKVSNLKIDNRAKTILKFINVCGATVNKCLAG